MENTHTCAITGHRPSRFKFKYAEDYSLCKKLKKPCGRFFRNCMMKNLSGAFMLAALWE